MRDVGDARARKVLIVTHTGELGGAESAVLRLLDGLDRTRFIPHIVAFADGPFAEAARARGLTVTLLGGGAIGRVTRAQAGSLRELARNAIGTIGLATRLRQVIREERPHLVAANSLKAAVVVAAAVPLAFTRTPWIWHLHDRIASDYLPRPVVVGLRLLARVGPRMVIANSRATAGTLGRMPNSRVAVAYPGLPASAFGAPRPRADTVSVGIVGRVSATKGQREFLDAAEASGGRHPSVRFRIIGSALFEDANVEVDLRARSERSPIADRIEWTGWTDDVPGALRQLDLLVHASPVPEPFGQVIVEGMAAGVPVIATAAGGVPEILDAASGKQFIAPGVWRTPAGLLVTPADSGALARALDWALTHPSEMSALVAHAGELVRKRFTIEQTAHVVEEAWVRAAVSARGVRSPGAPHDVTRMR